MSKLRNVHRLERAQITGMMARILRHDDFAHNHLRHFRLHIRSTGIAQRFGIQHGVLAEDLTVLEDARFIDDAEHVSAAILRDLNTSFHLHAFHFVFADRRDQLTKKWLVNQIDLSVKNQIAQLEQLRWKSFVQQFECRRKIEKRLDQPLEMLILKEQKDCMWKMPRFEQRDHLSIQMDRT